MMNLWRRTLLRLILTYLYYGASFCGMIPFRCHGSATACFELSKMRLLWSISVGLCSIGAIGYSSYWIVTLISYPRMDIVKHLIYCEFVIRFSVIFSGYITTWIHHKRLIALGNSVWGILAELKLFNIPTWIDRKLAAWVLLKVLLVDILMCVLFAINFHFNVDHDPVSLFDRAMNVYVVFLMAQVSNACLLCFYMAAHLYRSINWQVRITIGELCALDYVTNDYLKRRVFTDAATNLAVLSRLHFRTTQFVHGISYIYGISLALINLNQFLVIVTRIYFVYVSAVLEFRNEFQITINRYFNSILYLCFESMHFIYLVSAAELTIRRGRKTLPYLNEFFETEEDAAVTKIIKSFSLELAIGPPKISLYGLYEMDFTLLFSMVTAITVKLIVLVQIQLAN